MYKRQFESFRFFVGDVQHGTHLVPITGFESSGGEIDGFRHVRVDKTQPLDVYKRQVGSPRFA